MLTAIIAHSNSHKFPLCIPGSNLSSRRSVLLELFMEAYFAIFMLTTISGNKFMMELVEKELGI